MRVAQWSILVSLLLIIAMVPGTGLGQSTAPDADRTVTTIEIEPDGSAVWTVEVWTRLTDDAEIERFRQFQAAFRNDSSQYVDPFETRIRDVVTRASNQTGRQMSATEFTADTRIQEVPRRWGIVEYRFRWTNFARPTDDGLVVGDVFEGGYFLTQNDTLRIETPDSFERTAVEPAPMRTDGPAVEWTGEFDFADSRPHLVLTATTAGSPSGETEQTQTPTPSSPESDGIGSLLPIAGGLAVLLLLGGGYVYMRQGENEAPPTVTTDSEAVTALLEANDGRLKQAAVADELGWTASKTSRVLSSMEDSGRIERIRIGRENVVDLREGD